MKFKSKLVISLLLAGTMASQGLAEMMERQNLAETKESQIPAFFTIKKSTIDSIVNEIYENIKSIRNSKMDKVIELESFINNEIDKLNFLLKNKLKRIVERRMREIERKKRIPTFLRK